MISGCESGVCAANGFDHYIQEIDQVSRDMVAILYHYDQNYIHIKHVKYHLMPKTHFLTHLSKDIKRFGTALNFETEKGEQFNKHIREHIEHTNRTEVPEQSAVKFGKQAAMRHVVDGGSCLNQEGQRVKTGQGILNFVDEQTRDFCYHFFGGTREFADNNEDQSNNFKIFNKMFALFRKISEPSLLQVGAYFDGRMQVFEVQPASDKDKQDNVLRVSLTGVFIGYGEVQIDLLLDIAYSVGRTSSH